MKFPLTFRLALRTVVALGLPAFAGIYPGSPAPAVAAVASTPSWRAPVTIATGERTDSPQIGVDKSGEAVAVWRRFGYARDFDLIQTASRRRGGGWTRPIAISPKMEAGFGPQVAVNSSGKAVAVWAGKEGKSLVIESSTRSADGRWSLPETISNLGEKSTEPQVALNDAGDAVAVWRIRNHLVRDKVQSASRSAGGTWSVPTNISEPGRDSTRAKVAIDGSGLAIAIWERIAKGGKVIQSASLPAGGRWSAPKDLSAKNARSEKPHLAVNPKGEAVAVWQHLVHRRFHIQSTSRSRGSGWSAPVAISPKKAFAYAPQVALNRRGEAAAVWVQKDDNELTSAESAARSPRGHWSKPTLISGKRYVRKSEIAIDDDGDAVATWEPNENNFFVWGTSRLPRGGWAHPVDLVRGGDIRAPQLTITPDGEAIAVWENERRGVSAIESASRPARR